MPTTFIMKKKIENNMYLIIFLCHLGIKNKRTVFTNSAIKGVIE